MKNKLDAIEIPKELHERCIAGVKKAKEEQDMEQRRREKVKKVMEEKKMNRIGVRRIAAAAAVLTVCVFGIGNIAVADTIKGYFKDITRLDGAITGQEYLQADDEITMKVTNTTAGGKELYLSLEIAFLEKEKIEFRELEWVTVKEFSILDENGAMLVDENGADVVGLISDGIAKLELETAKDIWKEGETYTLTITEFEGCKKADAPLFIKGDWKCEWSMQ